MNWTQHYKLVRTGLIAVLLVLLVLTSLAGRAQTLIWFDEFDYTGAPDPAKWSSMDIDRINNEDQCYRPENAVVGGGVLTLSAVKETFTCPYGTWGGDAEYTSGGIETRTTRNDLLKDFTHGRYEVRLKVPLFTGSWPAVWLVGRIPPTAANNFTATGWPVAGEIDLMEAVGFEEASGTRRFHHTLHRENASDLLTLIGTEAHWPLKNDSTGSGQVTNYATDMDGQWFRIRMDWEVGSVKFYIDLEDDGTFALVRDIQVRDTVGGTPYWTTADGRLRSDPTNNATAAWETWPFDDRPDQTWALILNLALGGSWGGSGGATDDSALPATMQVDYVRVYNLDTPEADYCLSGTGNDNNSGLLPDQCWRTTTFAAANLPANNTLCFQAGTYGGWQFQRSSQTWKLCSGANLGDVVIDDRSVGSSGRNALIHWPNGIINTDLSGLSFDPDLWADKNTALHLMYQDGGNNNSRVHDNQAIGPVRNRKELRDIDSRRGFFRSCGTGNKLYDNVTRYFGGNSLRQCDTDRRLEVANNDFRYTSHHILSLASGCDGVASVKVGMVVRENVLIGSGRSDPIQHNEDRNNNPNPVIGANRQYPCRGGFAFVDNILGVAGENCFDGKGLEDSIIRGNVCFAVLTDSDGPPLEDGSGSISATCGGAIRGLPFTEMIVEQNLFVDTAQGAATQGEGSGVNNNTVLNLGRTYYGPRSTQCGTLLSQDWFVGQVSLVNNILAGNTSQGAGPMVANDFGKDWRVAGNVYEASSTTWRGASEEFTELLPWQAYLTGVSRFTAHDTNASTATTDQIFAENGLASYDIGTDWWAADVEAFIADLQAGKFDLEEDIQGRNSTDGGEPLALVTEASTGNQVKVGWMSTQFCCSAAQLSAFGELFEADVVRINGSDYTIVDIVDPENDGSTNAGGGYIQLDSAVSVSVGDAVDKVFQNGITSRALGAHVYWRGPGSTIPAPQRPPPPYQVAASAGDGVEVNSTMDLVGLSLPIGVTPTGVEPGMVQQQITDGQNDARRPNGSSWNVTSDRTEIGTNWGWLAFRDLAIPQGATITSATITFTAFNGQSSVSTIPIRAVASHNPTTPSGTSNPTADATAPVQWTLTPWSTGQTYVSADLTTLVQARVSLGDWVSGDSDIAFLFDYQGAGKRLARSVEGHPSDAPVLDVAWSASGGGGQSSQVALIMTTDLPAGASTSAAELVFRAAASDSDAAAWTIRGFLPPVSLLSSQPSNISSRSLTTASATCASVTAWTLDEYYGLDETACPGLSAVVDEIAGAAGYDGTVGLVITGTGTRQAVSYDTSASDAPGMDFSWLVDYTPSCDEITDQTLLEGAAWNFVASCTIPGKTVCPSFSVDFSGLPGGHDATLTEDPDPAVCEATLSWPTPNKTGQPFPVTLTVTDDTSGEQTQIQINLGVFNASADTAALPITEEFCDAEEQPDISFFDNDSTVLAMDQYRRAGLCWRLPVANGAVITNAYLQFTAAADDAQTANFDVRCEAIDDAPTFESVLISTRTLTDAGHQWAPVAWTAGDAGTAQRTGQMRRSIQEVVSRPGWVANNRIACVVDGSGALRRAGAFSNDDYAAPVLHATWVQSGTTNYSPVSADDTASQDDAGVDTTGDLRVGEP